LARDGEDSVKVAVLDNVKTSNDLLLRLCDDQSPLVSEKAKNMLYEKSKFAIKNNENGAAFNVSASQQALDALEGISVENRLRRLADKESEIIEREFLKVIAERSTTPPRRLAELAAHEDIAIRCLVAANPNASPEILWRLANDPSAEVRKKLFGNYNCPPDIIEYLKSE